MRNLTLPIALLLATPWTTTGRLAGQTATAAPRMTYLDNGEVRIGMDLGRGGAVTFLASRDHPANIINSHDLGRQIQMSHYSGPWPFVVGDKQPSRAWAALGWNPIQTGDCYGNPAKVVTHRNDGKRLYVKCIPMQWPLDDVPGDCVFETWTELQGPLIEMRFRCTNRRRDRTFYRPCPQELPAVYTVSRLWRLMSYTGDRPFTGGALTHVENDFRKPWPWTKFTATENWAALVDDDGWGLGVFKQGCGEFHGGIHGDGRSADPRHGSTAYVAPIRRENFDHDIVYEHRTLFLVGRLADIRQRFCALADRRLPSWRFARDRQHWTLHDATDQGFPLTGAWRIRLREGRPRLTSGTRCWRAEAAPHLRIEFAGKPAVTRLRIFWRRLDDDTFDARKSVVLDLAEAGDRRRHTVALAGSTEYRGLLTGLAIEPADRARPGGELAIHSIALVGGR